MTKKITLLFLLITFCFIGGINAQEFWSKVSKENNLLQKKELYFKKNFPKKYSIFSLKLNDLEKSLTSLKSRSNSAKIIKLPNSNGELKRFSIKETMYIAPELAAKFPMIKSYSAQGIDDPTATAKISLGVDGLHAVVYSGIESTLYLDPYTKDKQEYIVYRRSDLEDKNEDFSCEVEDNVRKEIEKPRFQNRNANDGKLRTFRLAIVCSGEYAQFHLNRQNVSASATDAEKKAAVLSAMNTSMTRINGVYERDLAVRMVLVADNDKVIFLDAATDNITDGSPSTMINQVQTICDAQIGDANYDIGHIFSVGGDGLAGLGVVCVTGQKARGVTGRSQPVNDPYDIDYVAHEMGHQFGATHTQNNSCNRTASTAVEPGSASTIMGYAGICAPNVQGNSDDHFHAVSIKQMWDNIQSSASCGVLSDTNNAAPTANAGSDYSIPKSTPFVLRGAATDADGTSSLTYNWEQIDNEIATMPPASTNTGGPAFRSMPSKSSPNRYMPALATVVSGNTSSTWEVVPSVARDMNFALTVRDNHAGGGNSARDDMKVTVTDAEAFTVTEPSIAVTWNTGSTQTITWNKGTTDAAPISCANVNIKLSTDGGVTFPITIKANTPNDGSEEIIIPDNASTQARIMVEAADNIFYNINSTNFTINSTTPTFIVSNTSGTKEACSTGNASVDYVLNFDFVNGFSETVTLSSSGAPSGANVSFNPSTINADGNVTMTVSNLNGANQQDYTIVVSGTSNSVTQNTDAILKILGASFSNINLTAPTSGATNVSVRPEFQWAADANATSYNIVAATDNTFSNIVFNETANTNSYIPVNALNGNTKYYWYVKPINSCGEGAFSSIGEFTTETPAYCASAFTQSSDSEYISNVTFNGINNTSGNDHSPTADDGYEDFTSISTDVKRGETHQISVSFDTAGYQDNCSVFIDWNQDYTFDKATERYDLGTKTEDQATATFDIKIPDDAVLGNTRMRVIIEYTHSNSPHGDGACTADHQSGWGETEDYTINIQDNAASIEDFSFGDFKLYPNPSNGEFNLSFKVLNTEKVSVRLHDFRGRLIGEKKYTNVSTVFTEKLKFDNVKTGLYLLQITNGNKQTTKKIMIH